MLIGIDARMYGGKQTGIGNYIRNLTNHLFTIDKKNDYLLFLLEPEFSKYKPPSPHIKKTRVDVSWYTFREQIKLPRVFSRFSLDLIHFPHFNAPLLYHRDYIITIHDITQKYFPGSGISAHLRREVYKLTLAHNLNRAGQIITVSDYTKQDLLRNFKVDEKKIKVVYEGIDPCFQPIARQDEINSLKNKYKIDKPFILYVGVLRDHKNIVGLIRAFDLVLKKYRQDVKLVIIGNQDPRYPEINKTIEKLKLRDRILTPGFVSKKELVLFYHSASILVLPSFREGFGFPPLEAMACGTPVAASNTTSLPEVLGNAALLFNPYRVSDIALKITKILIDKMLQEDLIAKGLQRTKNFSWSECAQKTLNLYQRIFYAKRK